MLYCCQGTGYDRAQSATSGVWLYTELLEKLGATHKATSDAERLAAIGETAGMVGHDIRNPLQAIVGDLYLLTEDVEKISDQQSRHSAKENLEAIKENIDYINKIIADLQDYARKTEPIKQETDIGQAVRTILAAIKIPANIHADFSCGQNILMKMDRLYIRRILTNLVTNAIQTMPKGGKLTVSLTREGENVQLVVGDTGDGMTKEVQDRLFSPLFTTKAKGQGFGLAVGKKFVNELDGTITFESQLGKGTKFTVILPNGK